METEVYERMAEIEDEHWWFASRRRILTTILESMHLPANASILEAGCGTGGNLSMLAGFGKVLAFEPDANARRVALEKGTSEVCYGSLPDEIPFQAKSFDLVVALDVLEHLEEEMFSLNRLYQSLKPGGWGLFTVPALPFLWSRHDEIHHHRRRYYKSSLIDKMTRSGFTIHIATYYNTFLCPIIIGVRFIKKIMKIQGSIDDKMPVPILNRMLRAVFSAERYLVNYLSLPVGVSLLLVVRRTEE